MLETLKAAKITQGEFALIVGVSRVTVNHWMNGKRAPNGVTGKQVNAMLRLIERAVERNLFPLNNGIEKTTRLTEIKKTLKTVLGK